MIKGSRKSTHSPMTDPGTGITPHTTNQLESKKVSYDDLEFLGLVSFFHFEIFKGSFFFLFYVQTDYFSSSVRGITPVPTRMKIHANRDKEIM